MIIRENAVITPLPNDELITRKEQLWRIKLPQEYKSFIMKYNGGIPKEDTILVRGRLYPVERFLCILRDTDDNKDGWYDISVIESQIGERLTANEHLLGLELVPIMQLTGKHYICLDYRKRPEHPSVCFWDNDESGEFDPVTYPVADSFTEFAKMLHVFDGTSHAEIRKTANPKFGFADFAGAGLVQTTMILPRLLWKETDRVQFQWLNDQIGGPVEGYIWHHTHIPGKMELVHAGMHNITTHDGGRTYGMWADPTR